MAKTRLKTWGAIGILLMVVIAFVPLSSADWPMFHSNPAKDGIGTGAPIYSLTLLWNFSTGDTVNTSPTVVNGTVYVTAGGYIYALNAATGVQQWRYRPVDNSMDSSPAVDNGIVYVMGGPRKVYAVNASNGEFLWGSQIYEDFASPPTVANGIVYIGTRNTYHLPDFLAFNATTGVQIWNFTTGQGGAEYSSPAVVNGIVYFGAEDGCVYALNATNGFQIWKYTAYSSAIITSSPAVIDNTVYIAISGHELNTYTLFALNASTGERFWSYTSSGGQNYFTTSPAVANGVIYIGSRDGDVYAFNALTGAQIWKVTAGTWLFSSPAVVDTVLYLGSGDGNVYALNCSDGSLISNYTVNNIPGRWVYSSPAVVNGVVYIGSGDHNVYALNGSLEPLPPKATPTPTIQPTSSSTKTSTPAPTPKPTTTPSSKPPTPTQTPDITIIQAIKNNGENVTLNIEGNITYAQILGTTITNNESTLTTTVGFTLTGQTGTAGFGNITLPRSAIPYGTTPTIYIDNQKTQTQGFTQDADNYYVWFTTHFSTHNVSIVFAAASAEVQPQTFLQPVIIAVMAVIVLIALGALGIQLRKAKS
ncbi:MAG: PQQ-binding-like beta-propeller repeat protein [Candidatus Bathyarchaeota archaeon]|nr:PQQ-binding-like beta-propeller repeat protein [Candidatus Bathyarchaeota archaeon]